MVMRGACCASSFAAVRAGLPPCDVDRRAGGWLAAPLPLQCKRARVEGALASGRWLLLACEWSLMVCDCWVAGEWSIDGLRLLACKRVVIDGLRLLAVACMSVGRSAVELTHLSSFQLNRPFV
eukprot:15455996-Alexandrium_andersonii.AAC.1